MKTHSKFWVVLVVLVTAMVGTAWYAAAKPEGCLAAHRRLLELLQTPPSRCRSVEPMNTAVPSHQQTFGYL